jgi:glycosyltransferase involved in cell wall biosynthesis
MPGRQIEVIVPDTIDDPTRPSGGNRYDRRSCRELVTSGWLVREHPVGGGWPYPDPHALAALRGTLDTIPPGAVVLIDGLIASAAGPVLLPQASRLRLVVLLHLPLGALPAGSPGAPSARVVAAERAVLAACTVIATSDWTRRQVLRQYGLEAGRVHVAEPGTDPAPLAEGTEAGTNLLCVSAVTPVKGQDVLLRALAASTGLAWECRCVGALQRDPAFADAVVRHARQPLFAGRVQFTGPLTGRALSAEYERADLVVLPSRIETYGMVIGEALARGVPVVASDVGGVAEALGQTPDGRAPGLLVAPEDPAALAAALRRWLTDRRLRDRLRAAALDRRGDLATWRTTGDRIAAVLGAVAA